MAAAAASANSDGGITEPDGRAVAQEHRLGGSACSDVARIRWTRRNRSVRNNWRCRGLRSWQRVGIKVAGSSDAPVITPDPLTRIRDAIIRRTAAGQVIGPGERLTVRDAITLHTAGSAYATHRETETGSLGPGKLADFTVLERNPLSVDPEQITGIQVLATFAIAEQMRADFPQPESAVSVMAMTSCAAAASAELYRDLRAAHLHPLWRIEHDLLTAFPRPRAVPWVWRAAEVYPLGERAIRAVPVDRGGERRVLSLGNPGLGGAPYAAGTLWGAVQCLGPGETAPAHRHTPGAIRFVLTGTGVWTTVNGDCCDMGPGDLVLTPSWFWHDHTNSGDRAMFWFDGLDLPMVEALDAVFYEQYPEDMQPAAERNGSEQAFAGDPARYKAPSQTAGPQPHGPSPLLVYRWADTDAELARLAREQPEAPVVSTEFANPATGGSVLPTLACSMHRLAAGGQTPTVRRTGNSIFVVFRGEGGSTAGGSRLDWAEGDMFVVPSWVPAAHWSGAGADLFELSDAPVLRALGLYREEMVP